METVRKVQLQLLLEGYSYRSAKKSVNKLLSICMNNFRKRLAICYCANWQPNFKNIDGKFVFVAKFVYFAL
jgi:hypothetical protein